MSIFISQKGTGQSRRVVLHAVPSHRMLQRGSGHGPPPNTADGTTMGGSAALDIAGTAATDQALFSDNDYMSGE